MRYFMPWQFAGYTPAARGALSAFLTLDPSAQAKIADAIKDASYPFSAKKLKEKAQKLHQDLKVLDSETLFTIMDTITDLVSVPPEFLSEVLTQTMQESGVNYSNLPKLISEIFNDSGFKTQQDIERFKHRALPTIANVEYFCAVKSRFDKDFTYREDSIESYTPRVLDRFPVAVVSLETDQHRKPLTFQLDEDNLNKLISTLIAVQKQLRILTEGLK